MKKHFYTQDEVMEILNASDSTILRWRKKNEIPEPVKIGRKIMGWPIQQFDEWFEIKMTT